MQPKLPTAEKMASTLSQHSLAVAIKFSVIAVAVMAFYFQDLSMVFKGALTDESTFHILAIPFLFAYLLFRKRKMISASIQPASANAQGFQKYFSTLTGITLSAVAILTYWYGSYTFTPIEYHMITLPFLAAGLTLILFNPQTLKQLLFPIAFLIFLTPPPSEILYSAGSALANLSASASNTLANVFGLHATLSTSNVGPVITLLRPDNTTLPFNVDVACSGVYSLIGFLIFAIVIAYITHGKLRNKFAILIMGIPLIVVLNIIRITTILAIGYNFGADLALQVFHTIGATVLMFIGTLLLLAITEKAFKKPKPPQPCPTCNPPQTNPTEPFCSNCGKIFKQLKTKLNKADIAKIVGIALIVVMLLSIQAPVFALTQGPAQVIIQTPSGTDVNTSNSLLPNIPGYSLSYVYRDTAYEQLSGVDAALTYSYTSPNETSSTVWVAIQIAASVSSEHRWETCLINWPLSQGQQATVNQLDLKDIQLQDNPPITARYFAFQYKDTDQTQVILYWYQTATFNTNGTAQTKSVMISIIMYPSSPQGVSEAEAQELPIANAINNYWQPIQTWSTIALAISQNGLALSTGATAILVLLILYAAYLDRKEKLALLNLYRKLPTQNQLIIKAVTNAKNINKPTTQAITLEYQKLSQTPTTETWITQKLNEAENIGLIKKILINKDDNPALAWKNQIPQKTILFKWLKT
ncbi:exosortase/archaeosortase family protein [Candidatus Bathyarchaeota archaeon]|nr:exosortase/archaeosortase family protein [Candidatus Bathyarchaeota archaeon]